MATDSLLTRVSCPRCGAGAGPDARFCASCGVPLVDAGDDAPRPASVLPLPPPAPPAGPPPAPASPVEPIAVPRRAVPPGVVDPLTSAGPAVEPSAVGRRASPLGWVSVVLVSGGLLAASLAVVGAASGAPGPRSRSADPATAAPVARWDRVLYDGSTIADGMPFTIEVEAVNAAETATDPLWLVIDWAPADLDATQGAIGQFVAADPGSADVRHDAVGNRTIVSWPAIGHGERVTLRATVMVTGLTAGSTFWYRVRTGSGPDEASIRGGYTWDLDLEVE